MNKDLDVTLPGLEEAPSSLEFAFQTDTGVLRDNNEDSVSVVREGVLGDLGLIVIADGMGGYEKGEIASKMAIETVVKAYRERRLKTPKTISKVFNHLDKEISEKLGKGGTTCVTAIFSNTTATFLNIGDSRGYLLRDGILQQITKDDSWVQQLIDKRALTALEAQSHPKRNVLTKALGTGRQEGVELSRVCFEMGDTVMLCSDGLSSVTSNMQIQEILNKPHEPLQNLCDALIKLAITQGSTDNITVACCRKIPAIESRS